MKPLFLALSLTAAASLPASALACSCMEIGGTWTTAPEDGQVDVPLNALIWVGAGITRGLYEDEEQHAIELLDPSGAVMTGGEGRLRGNWDWFDVFTPDLLLEPSSTYSIRVNGEIQATFTTGTESDTEAPEQPVETERRTWSRGPTIVDGGMCGDGSPSHGFSLSFAENADTFITILDAEGLADVDVDAIEGDVPALSAWQSVSGGRGFGCGGDNWDGARNGAEATFRVGSFDIAGNFSGWTEDDTIVVRPDPTAGCSAAGAANPSWLALLALGGVLVRRRD